jgi:hypothetical protein
MAEPESTMGTAWQVASQVGPADPSPLLKPLPQISGFSRSLLFLRTACTSTIVHMAGMPVCSSQPTTGWTLRDLFPVPVPSPELMVLPM